MRAGTRSVPPSTAEPRRSRPPAFEAELLEHPVVQTAAETTGRSSLASTAGIDSSEGMHAGRDHDRIRTLDLQVLRDLDQSQQDRGRRP